MPHSYTRSELTEYFFEALDMFNDCLDSNISKDNILLEFFMSTNGLLVYERFCGAHFPKMLEGLKRHPSNNGCDKQPVQRPLVETFSREVILVKTERHDAKSNQDGAKEHFPF